MPAVSSQIRCLRIYHRIGGDWTQRRSDDAERCTRAGPRLRSTYGQARLGALPGTWRGSCLTLIASPGSSSRDPAEVRALATSDTFVFAEIPAWKPDSDPGELRHGALAAVHYVHQVSNADGGRILRLSPGIGLATPATRQPRGIS